MNLRNTEKQAQKFKLLIVEQKGETKKYHDRFPKPLMEFENFAYAQAYLRNSRPSKLYVQFEPVRGES